MKKIKTIVSLMLAVVLAFTLLAGCAAKPSVQDQPQAASEPEKDSAKKSFTIGCMPLNEPAVQAIADMLKPEGYDVKVMVFDGNNLPAIALKDGSIDSLILNHLPWIKTFNEQNNCEIVLVEPFKYASLFGLYSSKYKSVEEIPAGATITISNDPSNMDRSLKMLEAIGFIKLGEKSGNFYTVLDIKENLKDIKFLEVETTATAASYKDVEATISFSSVMMNAGIDAFSYLVQDDKYIDFPTGLCVLKGNENSEWAQAVMKVTATEEYTKRFNEIFQGAYILFSDINK